MIRVNGEELPFFAFPNGESYFKKSDVKYKAFNKVHWMYADDGDFVKLMQLKDFLDSVGSTSGLHIIYMPYSRMDRDSKEYPFSLRASATLLNTMGWQYMDVTEPHSDVTPAILKDSAQMKWCQMKMDGIIGAEGITSIFFPDQGAAKRYETSLPYAVGVKRRNFKTGAILSFDLMGDVEERVLIVDDCCSAGGTFVHSAQLLKEWGAEYIALLVSYCEATVLSGSLFDHIDKMYVNKENCHLTSMADKIVKI